MLDPTPTAGFDAVQAHAEGWGLYTGRAELETITDLLNVPGMATFPDDVAAREFVAERIRAGSEYHANAVRHLRRTDVEGYKVFREEHPDCAPVTDIEPLF